MNPVEAQIDSAPDAADPSEQTPSAPNAPYGGLLFEQGQSQAESPSTEPFVHDLNLDQIVESIVAKREEPDYLRAHLFAQLHDEDSIRYRQEVFADLDAPKLLAAARLFADRLRNVREHIGQAEKMSHRLNFRDWPGIDRIGGEVLTMVAKSFPEEFALLESWSERHRGFIDQTVRDSERELDFYLAYRDFIDPIRASGLRFCLPEVSASVKTVRAMSTFDLALAAKTVKETLRPVVTNDLELSGQERIFVVSGPNQGGKTTFARTFGQLHHLASTGCAVPGTEAKLFVFDRIFTHFEQEEDLVRLSGRLEDDLVRIHGILGTATPSSILIMNEIFTSTALRDARYLGTKIMERIIDLDLLCVFVTFVDEMASMGPTVVSVMSTVMPSDPAQRTFRIVRAPANGIAHALALAEKHRLTYDQIVDRLTP